MTIQEAIKSRQRFGHKGRIGYYDWVGNELRVYIYRGDGKFFEMRADFSINKILATNYEIREVKL